MDLTEHRNLRGGNPVWMSDQAAPVDSDDVPARGVEIAIIGAGVVGAMLADRLAGQGHEVALIDRRPPAHGSTAASTALVMWAADVPLSTLAERIGEADAARRWRRVHDTVARLAAWLDEEGIDCDRIDRPELYLGGTLLDGAGLRAEGELRRRAGLPSAHLDAATVARRFGIAPRAALLSDGCYELDPVKLTLALLGRVRALGARCCFPLDVERLEQGSGETQLHLSNGALLSAARVIIASGYERATWFLPEAFAVNSSFAIATPPGTAPLWRENAMIWEASSPYLYCRATRDGRVIAGGEDVDSADATRRDAMIGAKAGILQAKLAALVAAAEVPIDFAWAAAFGASPDGLPAIGRARNHDGLWLAGAFGGNGVSFAALAAELIAAEFAGRPDPDAACFDPYRFDPA